ncbi:MAG: 4Fe-4S binding protein [Thermosipho sp. (in: Bacteria)]|nr:4Fe-4S binding protein [Thermosipho sp. (in: thermotogales)]
MADLKGWKELAIGGVIDKPSTAKEYQTGTWRVIRPVYKPENCINCMFCWLYCPDQAVEIEVVDGKPKMKGFNYYYCKGCGLCANVCPKSNDKLPEEKRAIVMKPETEFQD